MAIPTIRFSKQIEAAGRSVYHRAIDGKSNRALSIWGAVAAGGFAAGGLLGGILNDKTALLGAAAWAMNQA